MVAAWSVHNLVRNIKPTGKNARRVVDLSDVLRLQDQQLLPSLPRKHADSSCRSLLYVRMDPRENETATEEQRELTLRSNKLEAAFRSQVQVPPGWEATKGLDVGYAADFDRDGFVQLMAVIMRRDIDVLVVWSDEQLCPAACMPLLEWLCQHNLVSILRVLVE